MTMLARMTKSVFMSALGLAALAGGEASASDGALSPADQAVVAIAAHTADGNLSALKADLNDGLEAGLTVNEIKEVLVQLYAYAGFPRSLNGIHTFMGVMDERQAAGKSDPVGREPSPVPADLDRDRYGAEMRAKLGGRAVIPPPSGYQLFAPAIDAFLKEHLFCDIFIRDNLAHTRRELATVGTLAGMTGTAGQMVFHMNAAMNTGVSASEMKSLVQVIRTECGSDRADAAEAVLERVLRDREQKAKASSGS